MRSVAIAQVFGESLYRVLFFTLSLGLGLTAITCSSGPFAATYEAEPNNTEADAEYYPLGLQITGQLSLQEDLDYFAFQLSAGIFEVDVWSVESVWLEYNKIYILDSAGQIMSATDVYGEANYTQSNSQRISARISVPGKYYVVLGAGRIFDDGSAYHFDSPYAFIARLHADNDRDGLPDYIDVDDDNDNIEDLKDAFPFDSEEWLDTDGDGVGNNADNDDDNDGRRDSVDPNPLVNEGPIMTVINTILLDAE